MNRPGILVVSHGSREENWIKLVDEAVNAATIGALVPVVSSFLEIVSGRLIQDGIDELERRGVNDILVVPLFVSSGSTHVDEIGQAFGLPPLSDLEGDLGTFRVEAKITYGKPIDNDSEIAELLLANISDLSENPEREALLLIGHGSKEPVFHERWQAGLSGLAERLRLLGGYSRADYAMLLPDMAADQLRAMKEARPEQAVIVVPLFLSPGYFTNHVIPSRLSGLEYRYNGQAMLPHAAIARWLKRQMSEWLHSIGHAGNV
ncbi:CbiX/SirB N-terminal domain-containing protein [Paenibacillus sp. LHD-117]|uniref:sirohydrochlorin chelatase n=1 Tax=Paenibacillus sp. LHD-117 TaxID=3071412 RepID=UPI0027E0A0A8|nr:CbiX/SirB N-terminal domain-containing protein [Paenibacillus sp. LHD-117]MDQ6422525.1 CbiX/SirB N-terminal domain-containing protein [Paenibacillus sp. LHD-117]